MRILRSSLVLMVWVGAAIGCNEIVGAGRYHVGDASLDASQAPDAQVDASYCEPSERETYFIDQDSDDFGDAATSIEACDRPSGFAAQAGDCNDAVMSAHPGASEICDGVDSDCDGTIDEGVFGPIGTTTEVIGGGLAGSRAHSVAAYDGGFLVVLGSFARWLDVNGAPTGDAFRYEPFANAGINAAFVFEGTTPARAVIATAGASGAVTAWGFSANSGSTSLSLLEPFTAPTDPPLTDVARLALVPVGGQLALLALYSSGDDEGIFRGGAINPTTWSELGTSFETYIRDFDGAVPVDGTNGTLVSFSYVNGLSVASGLNWITLDGTGNLAWDAMAVDLGNNVSRAAVARTRGAPAGTDALMVVEDLSAVCLRHVTLGNPTDTLTATACEMAVTWSVGDMEMRDGVAAVLAYDGTYLEVPVAAASSGAPPVDAGVGPGARLAVRGGHGLMTFVMDGALHARSLGCE